jgi:hypothetical protein
MKSVGRLKITIKITWYSGVEVSPSLEVFVASRGFSTIPAHCEDAVASRNFKNINII